MWHVACGPCGMRSGTLASWLLRAACPGACGMWESMACVAALKCSPKDLPASCFGLLGLGLWPIYGAWRAIVLWLWLWPALWPTMAYDDPMGYGPRASRSTGGYWLLVALTQWLKTKQKPIYRHRHLARSPGQGGGCRLPFAPAPRPCPRYPPRARAF